MLTTVKVNNQTTTPRRVMVVAVRLTNIRHRYTTTTSRRTNGAYVLRHVTRIGSRVTRVTIRQYNIKLVLPRRNRRFTINTNNAVTVRRVNRRLLTLTTLRNRDTPTRRSLGVTGTLSLSTSENVLQQMTRVLRRVTRVYLIYELRWGTTRRSLRHFRHVLQILYCRGSITTQLRLLGRTHRDGPIRTKRFRVRRDHIRQPLARPTRYVLNHRNTSVIAIKYGTTRSTSRQISYGLSVVSSRCLRSCAPTDLPCVFPISIWRFIL